MKPEVEKALEELKKTLQDIDDPSPKKPLYTGSMTMQFSVGEQPPVLHCKKCGDQLIREINVYCGRDAQGQAMFRNIYTCPNKKHWWSIGHDRRVFAENDNYEILDEGRP